VKKDYVGFGYNPKESDNHFYVVIPEEVSEEVEVYERFHWDDEEQTIKKKDILKLRVPRHKWSKIAGDVTKEFNARLKSDKKPVGKFKTGGTPVEKLFGKELMVLLWGIEHNDPAGIPVAVRNWMGLQPEERWWLYTMTNASTGGINDRRGWRMALRYALCENPVDESNQMTLEQYFGGNEV
jgi:hypothetical protein